MLLGLFHSFVHFFFIHGVWGLFLLAFLETSFFPIPADILLIFLGLINPDMVLWYAMVATIGASLGGTLFYFIGLKAGMPLLFNWLSKKRIVKIEKLFEKYGGWALIIAGFTPIAYTAGLFKLNWIVFLITFTIGRGIKFAMEAILIMLLGGKAWGLIMNHHSELTTITSAVITGSVLLVYLLRKYIKNRRQK